MSKLSFLFPALVFPINALAIDAPDQSITIRNLSDAEQVVLVAAKEFELGSGVSLRVPCALGEAFEVQMKDGLVTVISCGAVMEVEE